MFIKGRHILDGPMIQSNVISNYKARKKKLMVFKVDFEKAFDSFSWKFLIEVMYKMGFSRMWCSWIRAALCSSKASVIVNGSPSDEFVYRTGTKTR